MTDLIKQVEGDLQKRIGGFGSEFNTSNIGSTES
jgi:hypothetical protein